MSSLDPALLAAARAAVLRAETVTVLTGAGISADSGLPTFRGAGGLWRNYRAQDLATPEAFARDPRMVWEWYAWRQSLAAEAEPNAGHLALVELERRLGVDHFTLVTQNVDGLHRRAGHSRPIELHGSLWRVRCIECGAERELVEPVLPPLPPRCEACGGIERPGVVWFGEGLPEEAFEAAYEASRAADVFLSIGTSGQVHPAAGLIEIARSSGRVVIEVNPEATAHASAKRFGLPGPAGEILPALIRGGLRPP